MVRRKKAGETDALYIAFLKNCLKEQEQELEAKDEIINTRDAEIDVLNDQIVRANTQLDHNSGGDNSVGDGDDDSDGEGNNNSNNPSDDEQMGEDNDNLVQMLSDVLDVGEEIAGALAAIGAIPNENRRFYHSFCSSVRLPYYSNNTEGHRSYCDNILREGAAYRRCGRATRLICIQCSYILGRDNFFCCQTCRTSTLQDVSHSALMTETRYNAIRNYYDNNNHH